MNEKELFNSWINLTKYHERILKALDYTLQNHYHLGIKAFYLLLNLSDSGQKKLNLSDLVPKVGLSHSALSRLVTKLESYKGETLLERKQVDNDKRSVDIMITESGERILADMQYLISESLQKHMSEKDIENIQRLVE